MSNSLTTRYTLRLPLRHLDGGCNVGTPTAYRRNVSQTVRMTSLEHDVNKQILEQNTSCIRLDLDIASIYTDMSPQRLFSMPEYLPEA